MAFAFVQGLEDSSDPIIFAGAPTAGNILVVWTRWEGASGTGNYAVSQDGGGGTFTTLARVDTSSGDHHAQFHYLLNCGTSDHLTVTPPASATLGEWIAIEISSSETPSFDTHNVGSGSGTSLASGAITLGSAANWFVIGAGSSYSGGQTYSAHQINGVDEDGFINGATFAYSSMWRRALSSSFTSGTATATNTTSDAWICNILAFKAGTGAAIQPLTIREFKSRPRPFAPGSAR
jgi:hypothetical protein